MSEQPSPQDNPEPQPIARIRPVRAQVRLPERVPFVKLWNVDRAGTVTHSFWYMED